MTGYAMIRKIQVTFEMDVTDIADDADDDEITAWLEYNLGASKSISNLNPLKLYGIEAERIEFNDA